MNYAKLQQRKMESVISNWEIAGQHIIEELKVTGLVLSSDDRARIVDIFNRVFAEMYRGIK